MQRHEPIGRPLAPHSRMRPAIPERHTLHAGPVRPDGAETLQKKLQTQSPPAPARHGTRVPPVHRTTRPAAADPRWRTDPVAPAIAAPSRFNNAARPAAPCKRLLAFDWNACSTASRIDPTERRGIRSQRIMWIVRQSATLEPTQARQMRGPPTGRRVTPGLMSRYRQAEPAPASSSTEVMARSNAARAASAALDQARATVDLLPQITSRETRNAASAHARGVQVGDNGP